MRFDIISIFPDFFSTLDLSLVGKARDAGVVDVAVHNLRDWAIGTHLAVDDTPTGGGAGMVMRPDVWGDAIDSVLAADTDAQTVLAIPTPSGKPLTQRDLEALSKKDHILIACGRYEGIDARVASHYAQEGVDVFEFSLGDYVLNGGEVAAIALVEGVSRLVEGVVGNPASLSEESHSEEGLLEYPVYTQPRSWRGLEVPQVLLSGDHAKIKRWRRDQALIRTERRRHDMVEKLIGGAGLDKDDREALAFVGIDPRDGSDRFAFDVATEEDLPAVSALAQETFVLACPPGTPAEEIDDFVTNQLDLATFHKYLDEGARVTVVRDRADGSLAAYCLIEQLPPPELRHHHEGACYLSKIYADPAWHGSGVSAALMEFALADAVSKWGTSGALLGTNKANVRAIRFYKHHGFVKVGRRVFNVGGRDHHDFVFVRDLTVNPVRYGA